MSENHKEFVTLFYETAYVQHDLEEAAKMMAESYVLNDPSEPTLIQGIEQWKQMQIMYLTAFPDHRLEISHQIAENDFVLTHWFVTGTHITTWIRVRGSRHSIQQRLQGRVSSKASLLK
jgi:hypothetical protein